MGTPDFAAECLRALIDNKYDVIGAVTQPDKPRGRGHKLTPCEVKELALENNIEVYQPETLKNGELQPILDELRPDIIVVAAYGKILPEYVINYPKYGCINVHGSILPKYRGAAPIQWAVIDGEKETGITTMLMDKGLDTGDILMIEKTPISDTETSAELFDRLAFLGGEVLIKTIEGIKNGTVNPTPQGDNFTYARMIKKEDGIIDWNKPKREILNLIRGMNSWPMAVTTYEGQQFKVISASDCDNTLGNAGEIADICNEGLKVYCADGCIRLKEIQFPGSRRMSAFEYSRGHELKTGVVLGK